MWKVWLGVDLKMLERLQPYVAWFKCTLKLWFVCKIIPWIMIEFFNYFIYVGVRSLMHVASKRNSFP